MRHIGWWLSSMLMLLLLMMVSCSQDSSNDGIDEPQNNLLRLSSVTRSSSEFTPSEGNSIKMYVMTKDAQYSEGNFNYTTSWANSNIRVKEHEQYYMYGFMPGSYESSISATATELNGDYSRGADLTISDLPIFTSQDICAIVGVQRISATSEATNIVEGNFGYLSGLNSENYVNLLMDHLYGELALRFKVDADYYALRHIKLKSVTLNYDNGQENTAANVSVTVRLRNGYGLVLTNSIAYTPSGNKASHTFLADGSTFLNSNATAIGSGVKCPPSLFDPAGTYMTLTCTYDVCSADDTHNVIRANCTASNKMRVSGMDHGKTNTVTVTIAPTYLYVLTDPDLDNPTIYIGG